MLTLSVVETAVQSPSRRTLGLFGGTFDPVHNGHLRMALELKQVLNLTEMRLLPCHQPPHRQLPGRSSADRAAMVRLAVAECEPLTVDERELKRQKPSYTVDTLAELRAEQGPEVSLCWCVGMDSLVTLHQWHRWRELLDYGHLVVTARPGWQVPETGTMATWLQQHLASAEQLHQRPSGAVVVQELTRLDISATEIRAMIAAGRSPQFLLPDAVWRYIEEKRLYREESRPQGKTGPEA